MTTLSADRLLPHKKLLFQVASQSIRSGPRVRFSICAIFLTLCLLAPPRAHAQQFEQAAVAEIPSEPVPAVSTPLPDIPPRRPTTKAPSKPAVESEIAESNMISYGSHKLFGAAERCNVWAAGVEYDRHSWGYFLRARLDYVAEVLPFVLLSEPTVADVYGNPRSDTQRLVPGVGVSPIGFRMLWRSNKRVKPYLIGKFGVVAFPRKVLSPSATAANFNLQGDFGVQIRLSDRVELRLDPLAYFHFSNGYLAASNPGLDELAGKFGLSYRLGRRE